MSKHSSAHSPMSHLNSYSPGGNTDRYSARKMTKPVHFYLPAPAAQAVSVIGDFNKWNRFVHPMTRQADGLWVVQVPLHHGHHQYLFMVDGKPQMDPQAHGSAPHEKYQKVSVLAIS